MKTEKKVKQNASDLLRPYRSRILALCLSTVTSSVLQVGAALLTKEVVDAALSSSDKLLQWGLLLMVSLGALVALSAGHSWFGGKTADICVAQLRRALLQRIVCGEEAPVYGYHSGSLLSRSMEDVRTLCDGMVNVLPTLTGHIVRLVASFGAVLLLLPSAAWVIALAALTVAAGAVIFRPILKKHHKQVRAADEQVMTAMQEDLQNRELIKGLSAETQILDRFDRRLNTSLEAHGRRRVLTVSRNTFISAVSQLGTGALLLWGATRVAGNAMSYGALAAMLQLIALLRNPVLGMSGLWTRLAALDVAKERLEQILQEEPQAYTPAQAQDVRSIVFENVTFAYPGEEIPVLENFSMELPLDRWVCLTGVSGKGKSTLFKLILGLHKPQGGRVYLVTDRGEISCGVETRFLFSYVPQDYALLSGSVMDNLLLVTPDATPEQISRAISLAQADFVWQLPAKENTQVMENNAGLSMGQLQRLAVARAILMDRPIFLLDECTSALDSATEEALLQALLQLDKKGVLVTHRPEAVKLTKIKDISSKSI